MIKLGDNGPAVVRVQELLVKHGFLLKKEVDGIFGNDTKSAVIKFQKSKSLDADGIVGNDTINALNNVTIKPDVAHKQSQLLVDLINIFKKEIGVKETGKNTGPRIKQYQASTWLSGTGWAWCAAFICFGIKEWLKNPEVKKHFNLINKSVESFRPQTAGAWDFLNWAKSREAYGIKIISNSSKPRTGDIMIFNISHIEFVESFDGEVIHTIGGNTDGSGGREGDGVYRRQRHLSEARAYIRLIS